MEFIESEILENSPQIRFMKEFLVGHPGFIAGGGLFQISVLW